MPTTATKDETLHEAVVAALSELSEIVADETADTGQYRYKYAGLPTIMRAVRPVLAAHGLVVSQIVASSNGELIVGTSLVHRSGQSFGGGQIGLKLPPTPQALGSLVSYLRRYQLVALLGLAIEDDDAKVAQSAPPPAGGNRRTSGSELTAPQRTLILTLFGKLGLDGPAMRPERLEITSEIVGRQLVSTNQVTRDEAPILIEELRRRVAEHEADEPGMGYE